MPGRMWAYHKFAKLYHWPPFVVNRLGNEELYWLPLIAEAENEALDLYMQINKSDD